MSGYFGRHSADDDWPDRMPVLVYLAWPREDRPPRHAKHEPLMLPASRRPCQVCGVSMVYPHAPWCPAA